MSVPARMPPRDNPSGPTYSKKDLRNLEALQSMNAESGRHSILPPLEGFDYFSGSQKDDFASGIDEIIFRMESTRREKRSMATTRRLEKKTQKKKHRQLASLSLSSSTKHLSHWCSSTHLSPSLSRSLSHPVDADASGSIYSPFRDLPRTKAGQSLWRSEKLESFRPGEVGKMFGESPISTCAETYQGMLERHLSSTLKRVKAEYEAMRWGTIEECERKGGVGRDLAALEERLRRVKASLGERVKRNREEKKTTKGAEGWGVGSGDGGGKTADTVGGNQVEEEK